MSANTPSSEPPPRRLFLAGEWVEGEAPATAVDDKFHLRAYAEVQQASREQVVRTTRLLAKAVSEQTLAPAERRRILAATADLIAEQATLFRDTIVHEAGFTIADAEREVARAQVTLALCAEEATRLHGEVVPLGLGDGLLPRSAITTRYPLGVVCAISPFNSPLNTVVHKVGPAIAAGNAVVLKPASYTPGPANLLVETLLAAGLPTSLIGLLHGGGSDVGQWLLDDPVPAFYAFTGSTEVGARVAQGAGIRRTQLELGSIASTIVCSDADLERAIPLCVNAAFRKAGQVCTSVQRLYVERPVFDQVAGAIASFLDGRVAGDPALPTTYIGPLISPAEADRVEAIVSDALDAGAELLVGGERTGSVIQPTVLVGLPSTTRAMREEIFGPVLCLCEFESLNQAIDEINDTPFGLASGIFTNNLTRALETANQLRVGSVHINETSNGRLDMMPYQGVKASGLGREGPRYAMLEMTEERLITMAVGGLPGTHM